MREFIVVIVVIANSTLSVENFTHISLTTSCVGVVAIGDGVSLGSTFSAEIGH